MFILKRLSVCFADLKLETKMLPNHTTMLGVIKENINLIFADYCTHKSRKCPKSLSEDCVDLCGSGGERPF